MENQKQGIIMMWISVVVLLLALGILIYSSKFQPPKEDKAYNFCMELAHQGDSGYRDIQNCQQYLGIKIITNN
jgi:hypothetical protein